MRAKRSKQYRKLMQQYSQSFAFHPPYQILLDAAIIQLAHHQKLKLGDLLKGTLHGEIKPMITQCCIRHLYTAETDGSERGRREKEEWIETAKQAERRRCGHHELVEPLSAMECLVGTVDPKGSGGNRNRYVVATQDLEIRQALRKVVGCPLVYINRSVMILEPMATKSVRVREGEERSKLKAGLISRRPASAGAKRKRENDEGEDEGGEGGKGEGVEDGAEVPERVKLMQAAEEEAGVNEPAVKKRKVKGPKGPNPMSVKKAKPNATSNPKTEVKANMKAKRDGEGSKSVGRQVEDERSVIRKAAKSDPHAGEKAVDPEVAAVDGGGEAGVECGKKRKRKRKGNKEGGEGGGEVATEAVGKV
ncbi:hypothetical protein LTR56_018766 [Elasticomyces elasticus]|nr:hypothetical protein LTR56_018766 [Elasticomyces elasticus]KAK3635777.1 hypothetical protein LTR22_019057 [Elasticomyces elasticus]KAK4911936.1 hypothetical protein LTR49_019583 [Elasticomyces elasticus]KAK5736190.1 hypothetical protein LTS12_026247 [Elasticomyces elasticus]